ncbi:MAG TPA: L-lysine 6-transaminase [Bdellovibrionota bacterium]|nr:L-lysine 6-transaminase [Bdellovibrionota bacterium]
MDLHAKLGKYVLAEGFPLYPDVERSHGAYLYDTKSNQEFLDLFSFFVTQPLGFNHPKLATDEFKQKLGRFAVHRPTLSDVYTPEYVSFVETFARVAGRGYFEHYFFVEGGALGVENTLKVAFDWKVRKNLAKGRGEKGHQIIHFREAFHGRSGYTVSMTNTFDPNKHQYFAKFSWPRVTNPKLRFPVTNQVLDETIAAEKRSVAEIEKAVHDHPDDIAALIIEPIQSEGGDNHFRPEFLKELRRLADEHDFLLIFDEVQTGIGLTGKMWAFEHFGVVPDLIAFGKKVQVGGCLSTTRVDEVKDNVFHMHSRINSTWGGNLVDMIRSERYLQIIEEDRLVENVANVGEYFLARLNDWAQERPRISNVRGRGLLMAFDLPDTATRDLLRNRLFENQLMILGCGPKSLRIRPHLDFTRENADRAMELLTKTERLI